MNNPGQDRVELFHEARHALGEGPLWDHKNGILYWVDILGKKICGLKGGTYFEHDVGREVGALTLTSSSSSSELLLALLDGVYRFNPTTKSLQLIPGSTIPDNDQRYNDGKCDATGRLIVGTTSLSGRLNRGWLLQFEHNAAGLARTILLEGVSISNGLCWNRDSTVMYYIDSPTGEISAFEYRLSNGSLAKKQVFARIPPEEGVPDGMTIDKQGRLYVAHWGGGKVSVWDTDSGDQIDELPVPALNVTSCAFAGEDLSELIITTARTELSEEQLKQYPLSGSLFRYRSNTRGNSANVFMEG